MLGTLTIFQVVMIDFPAMAANAYNLFYASNGEQVFYFDIDGLVLVVFECILILIVMYQRERIARFDLQELLGTKPEEE